MEKFDVTYRNKQVGAVELIKDGLFTILRCKCTYFHRIMRLYGFSETEIYNLGVLSPSDDGLCLMKKYTKNDLQKTPLDTCIRFEIFAADEKPEKPEPEIKSEPEPKPEEKPVLKPEPPKQESEPENPKEENESLWKPAEDPASLFADPDIKETASSIKGGLIAHDGDTVLFAIPISSEYPFPLMPVFRYGSSAMVEGKCCIVFQIRNGYLV